MNHLSLSLFKFSLRYFLTPFIEYRSIQRRECHDLAEGLVSGSLTRDRPGLGSGLFGLVVINLFGNVTHEISCIVTAMKQQGIQIVSHQMHNPEVESKVLIAGPVIWNPLVFCVRS